MDGKNALRGHPAAGRDLTAKTLEAWVALPTLKQGGGGVMSVQTLDGRTFDAIVFAEREAAAGGWPAAMALPAPATFPGRTRRAKPDELVHVAITYDADGRIAVYRNGRLYGERLHAGRLEGARHVRREGRRRSSSGCGTPAAGTHSCGRRSRRPGSTTAP